MLIKKVTTAAVAGLATLLSVSVANAVDSNFNAKELNGHSNYLSVARIHTATVEDVSYMGQMDNTTGIRTSKTAAFKDADGYLGAFGTDFGYVRVETEVGHRDTEVTGLTGGGDTKRYKGVGGSVDIGTIMANLALEYSVDPSDLAGNGSSGFSITPYVSVGGGALGVLGNLNFLRAEGIGIGDESLNNGMFIAPAIQGGAGLTIGLPFGVEVFGGYSELLGYTYNYKGSNDIHIRTYSGGLRLNF
jgi:hypothetical protein